jgi:hypothetical protein
MENRRCEESGTFMTGYLREANRATKSWTRYSVFSDRSNGGAGGNRTLPGDL